MTTSRFERRSTFAASIDDLFAWHEAPGALERLMPPWETARVALREGGLEPGARVHVRLKLGPLWLPWDARHTQLDRPHVFQDAQDRGPFASWTHTHRFTAVDAEHTELHDDVEYSIHGGPIGSLAGGSLVRDKLERMFAFRHRVLARDLARHTGVTRRLRVAVTGSTGLIGSALCAFLTTGGHAVTRLVRRQAQAPDEVRWDPKRGLDDVAALEGLDAVVHLAGEPIADKAWSAEQREAIASSRVDGTARLVAALASLERPPAAFVCASGVGAYGPTRGGSSVDEDSSLDSSTFLGDVAVRWEDAAARIEDAGVRRVSLRIGVVMSPRGGALAKLMPLAQWGLAGRIGSGQQRMSWVSLDDAVGAIHWTLIDDSLSGPINIVSPEPLAQVDVARTLARVLRRPAVVPTPAFAVRLALGERADPFVLDDLAVRPARLAAAGFEWHDTDFEGALRHMLGRVTSP